MKPLACQKSNDKRKTPLIEIEARLELTRLLYAQDWITVHKTYAMHASVLARPPLCSLPEYLHLLLFASLSCAVQGTSSTSTSSACGR